MGKRKNTEPVPEAVPTDTLEDSGQVLLDAGPSPHRGWSYFGTAMKCLRLYALKKVWGRTPGSEAQAIGAAIHLGLAHYYERARVTASGDDPDYYFTPHTAINVGLARGVYTLSPAALSRAHNAIESIIAGPPKFTVEYVETPFPLELGPLDCPGHDEHGQEVVYGPRLDLVYRDSIGKYWIVDHKTTSKGLDKTFLDIYALHGQFIAMNAIGLAYFKRDFGGVLIHGIQTVPPYRETWDRLPPAPAATAAITGVLMGIAHRIADLEVQAGWSGPEKVEPSTAVALQWPGALNETVCYHRYGPCEASTECLWGADASSAEMRAAAAERGGSISFDF